MVVGVRNGPDPLMACQEMAPHSLLQLLVMGLCIAPAAADYLVHAHASALLPTTRVPAFYHTTADVRRLVSDLAGTGADGQEACPGLSFTRTEVTPSNGDSGEANVLDAVRIRRGHGPKRNRLALMFGEHGRELVTTELAVHLLKALCGRAGNSSAALVEGASTAGGAHTRRGTDVTTALQQRAESALADTEFLIMPNVDENGRQRAESGEPCLSRDNANHVDLNRNWDYKWKFYPNDEEGGSGARAFSERETVQAREHLEDFKPTSFLSVHSGARGIYLPGAYSQDESHAKRELAGSWDTMLNIAKDVNEATGCDCTMGSAGRVAHKDHPGTSLDYAGLKMGVPYSMVFEVWLNSCEDCVPHFSPHEEATYRRVVNTWANSLLYYAEATAKAQSGNKSLRSVRRAK